MKNVSPGMHLICGVLFQGESVYLCNSEKKLYLGLCDESVSVAGKVLRAACRLLIHIRHGWL